MNISLEFLGCYHAHKEFFDAMAEGLQKQGHRVGIISPLREKDPYTGEDTRARVMRELGFKPDFVHLWGYNESISNGDQWTCQRMEDENIYIHFGPNGSTLKRWTTRACMKTMDNAAINKF